ncbi:helix-turn-helix transcriptional regulator [Microbacterium maritypicum]|uniref:helix-turn-helix transcriptional regulator n=1 Tax=Microbacterium maritypicum TaxID=33918 RepID=UPI0038127951
MLTSPWGGGRERLTLQVASALEGLGIEPIRIDGFRGSSSTPFATLRMWDPSLFRGNPDTGTVADRLVAEWKEASAVCLVINDFDLVDPYSAAVLEIAHQRLGATAMLSLGLGKSDALATSLLSWPVEFVSLPLLSFNQVDELLQSRVENSLSPTLVSRIYIDSGGNPAIAVALLENSIRTEKIQIEDGVLVLCEEDLWGESLIPLMARYVSDLPEESRWQLERICLEAEPTLLEDSNPFVDDRVTLDLERRGLLSDTLANESGKRLFAPKPPLLQKYFRSLSGRSSQYSYSKDERISTSVDDAISAHELEEFHKKQASESRREFHENPNLRTANLHLKSLWCYPSDPLEVLAIFEEIPVDVAFTHEEFKNIVFRYQWEAFRNQNITGAKQILDAAPQTPALRALAKAHELILDLHTVGLQANFETRIAEILSDSARSDLSPMVNTALAYVFAVSGIPLSALSMLPDDPPEDHLAIWILAAGLSHIGAGQIEKCLELMRRMKVETRQNFDADGTYAVAYVVALLHICIGNWVEGARALENVRAMGTPGLLMSPLRRAVLQLSGLVIAESGKQEFAETLIQHTEADAVPGPLPGQFTRTIDLVHQISSGDGASLASSLIAFGNEAHLRNYDLSAALAACWALSLNPISSVLRKVQVLLSAEMSNAHEGLLSLAKSLIVSGLARDDISPGELRLSYIDTFLAQLMLMQHAALIRAERPEEAAMSESYARSISELSKTKITAAALSPVRFDSEGLTAREREVALLADQMSNLQIAHRLGISKRTVDHHISNALRKTEQSNRKELHALVAGSTLH